jgi:branched-subunit amino acid ABC-type transport system permease component
MSLTAIEFLLGPLPQVIALLVAAIVGTIFAIRRRKSQPLASRLLILGFSAILINALGSYAVRVYSYRTFDKWHDASIYGRQIAEVDAILHSINVVGVILLAAAVFANRAAASQGKESMIWIKQLRWKSS